MSEPSYLALLDSRRRFLTLAETAEYLGLKLSKIYEMSARDALPGKVKFDGVVRVDRQALDAAIAENIAQGGGGRGE